MREIAFSPAVHEKVLEKAFARAIAGLADNISGTTDGSTDITDTQKETIVTLLKSPQF